MHTEKKIAFVVLGVSGVGKTTIGQMLAAATSLPFFDGDDFHPQANIDKMAAGVPLTDADRQGWLLQLHQLLQAQLQLKGCVLACSALKQQYRDVLNNGLGNAVVFVYLQGSYEEVLQRLQQRKGHFMHTSLLQSQFDALEPPTDAITVAITKTPEAIVQDILTSATW
ncbi:gluconokinase [Parasediminibacterium paludis]|uniref:Gluconokinase n=1 Tax=Parasediminibacterium paludis TaxID=908966 RepID=A0ABV8PX61_9BACT